MDSSKAVRTLSGGSYGGKTGGSKGIVTVGLTGVSLDFCFLALTFVTKTSTLPAVSDWLILDFCSQAETNRSNRFLQNYVHDMGFSARI